MILRLNENNINTETIHQIVKCLKDGGVIIYPTDTVYALG
ncbi:MAG: threonylcarbamoyl-AMP synthase, partial [Bacteroidia bacterium]|nr:threonylcarbamoyl-AMP synthase [Bacteroidia bacterium]